MNPVLHVVLRDGIQKYLNGHEQTMYVVDDPTDRDGTTCLEENTPHTGGGYNVATNETSPQRETPGSKWKNHHCPQR